MAIVSPESAGREASRGSAPSRRQPFSAFDVVVLAASAGGPSALRVVLKGLPPDFPAPVIVIQHRSPSSPSVLLGLLQRQSAMPVRIALPTIAARRGTIWVAAPTPRLQVTPTHRFAVPAEARRGRLDQRCTADEMLTSVAQVYGDRSMAVVLTGLLDDGKRGVWEIKRAGGRVLVQDPATAACPDMPRAAVATGCADFVLPLEQIAAAIVALAMAPGAAAHFHVPTPDWVQGTDPPPPFGHARWTLPSLTPALLASQLEAP